MKRFGCNEPAAPQDQAVSTPRAFPIEQNVAVAIVREAFGTARSIVGNLACRLYNLGISSSGTQNADRRPRHDAEPWRLATLA